jgi:hypothetical protein
MSNLRKSLSFKLVDGVVYKLLSEPLVTMLVDESTDDPSSETDALTALVLDED